MYGLPSDTDVSGFVGQELQVIWLGKWQVSLIFSTLAECSVTIEGEYSVKVGGQVATRFSSSAGGASQLADLLMKTVVTAVVVDDSLLLTFEDGSAVEIHDSETSYESYQFTVGRSFYVV